MKQDSNKKVSLIDKIAKCNLVEIYDKRTNEIIIKFVANKKIPVEKQVLKAMEAHGFKFFVKGTINSINKDLYWIAKNKDYSCLHLKYREKEINKKDLYFDIKGYAYTCYSKKIKQLNKEMER